TADELRDRRIIFDEQGAHVVCPTGAPAPPHHAPRVSNHQSFEQECREVPHANTDAARTTAAAARGPRAAASTDRAAARARAAGSRRARHARSRLPAVAS